MGVHIVETYRTAEFQMLLLLFSGLLDLIKVKENATRLQRYQSKSGAYCHKNVLFSI